MDDKAFEILDRIESLLSIHGELYRSAIFNQVAKEFSRPVKDIEALFNDYQDAFGAASLHVAMRPFS
jgi:hypothetical protein